MQIPLGFQVGTGEPVSIPLDHMLVTGRTRKSGKTSTLEAIATRGHLRVLTFLTKPGEDTFTSARRIKPYFHNQGGWRFIASVLEATMGEKLKRERAEIINASKGTTSLQEAYRRVVAKKAKAKSSWVVDMLTTLEAYFEIVLPQIEATEFSDRLEIGEGINVIDLSDSNYTGELRSLVIRSALEWVLKHERGVLTVIPEAWQFIPASRGNPVKQGCEALIRMGGVLNNWVAIDSQEVTSIDPGIRKSCGVWILGVQRELNEVKRVIDQLPGQPKPKPDDVMQLGVGQFYVSYTGEATKKVYVWPAWLNEDDARSVAMGDKQIIPPPGRQMSVPEAIDRANEKFGPALQKLADNDEPQEEEEDMASLDETNRRLDSLIELMARNQVAAPPAPVAPAPAVPLANGDEEGMYQRFKTRLLGELPSIAAGRPITVTPPEKLRKDFQRQESDRIIAAARALSPLAKRVLKLVETTDNDQYISQKTIADRLGRSNTGNAAATLAKAIDDLRNLKFVEVKERTGVRRSLYDSIASDLAFYKPTQQEVEAVHQTVLYELATAKEE